VRLYVLAMRGQDTQQNAMFCYISPERRVPADHPLRRVRTMVDGALSGMSRSFSRIYVNWGRPSIAPEKLLRALLLQVLYSIRSEGMLMEQLEYNLLFRWFVGLNVDEAVWVPTVFSKNRDRLLRGDIAEKFFAQVLEQARDQNLLSDEPFSVDGTLIEAWASQKSFQRKDPGPAPPQDDPRNPTVNFHGEKRRNDTHASTTDPEARLARKSGGHEARLAYCGNVLIENRNGLGVDTELVICSGTAEREAAVQMVERIEGDQRVTVGADKAYDTQGLVRDLRERNVTPHVSRIRIVRAAAPSMVAPHGMRDTKSANASGNGSKRCLDGSRRSACCARRDTVESSKWAGCSPLRRPPTIWCG